MRGEIRGANIFNNLIKNMTVQSGHMLHRDDKASC